MCIGCHYIFKYYVVDHTDDEWGMRHFAVCYYSDRPCVAESNTAGAV